MTLNETGKKIKRALIKYLKEIEEYRPIENTLLIENTAMAYQMYEKYLEEAEATMLNDQNLGLKLHALSAKFYVNYITNLKTLGISAIQRKKLNQQEKSKDDEESIFKAIKNARNM